MQYRSRKLCVQVKTARRNRTLKSQAESANRNQSQAEKEMLAGVARAKAAGVG
jgi:hypothetical protein